MKKKDQNERSRQIYYTCIYLYILDIHVQNVLPICKFLKVSVPGINEGVNSGRFNNISSF